MGLFNRPKPTQGILLWIFCLALGVRSIAFCAQCQAGEIVEIQNGILFLNVQFRGLLNDRAKKDLTSGLSTKAVILGEVLDPSGNSVVRNLGTISVKYDLWEETFYSTVYRDKYVLSTIDKAIEVFEKPRPLRLIALSELKSGVAYRVRSVETINPLDLEKFEAVQEWMIQQKSAVRGLGGGIDSSVVPSAPETAFKTLFYSLWKRSKMGEALTGELRREVVSEPFILEDLKKFDSAGRGEGLGIKNRERLD